MCPMVPGVPVSSAPAYASTPCGGREIPTAPGAPRLDCLSPDLLERDGGLQAAWQAPRQ
jgi:hypothetical protein